MRYAQLITVTLITVQRPQRGLRHGGAAANLETAILDVVADPAISEATAALELLVRGCRNRSLGGEDGENELARVECVENVGDDFEVGACRHVRLEAGVAELALRGDMHRGVLPQSIVFSLLRRIYHLNMKSYK